MNIIEEIQKIVGCLDNNENLLETTSNTNNTESCNCNNTNSTIDIRANVNSNGSFNGCYRRR